LNLPDGTVQGPLSFRGEKVNFRCRYSLTILGTLHHQGSITGLRKALGSPGGKGAKQPTTSRSTKLATKTVLSILTLEVKRVGFGVKEEEGV